MSNMNDVDNYEIYEGYKHLALYLVIILGGCALLTLYLIHIYSTGNPQMFNLTNDSYNYMMNSSANMTALKTGYLVVGGVWW